MNGTHNPRDETPNQHHGEGSESGNSLSRDSMAPQPTDNDQPLREGSGNHDSDPERPEPAAHVVLYQPEIPQNTGNIGRTCVAVDAKLWIVRPAGFRLDDTRLRRAGLDYWQHLNFGDAANWDDLIQQLAPQRLFFLSRFATRTIWDAQFQRGDAFVFGRETSGLPKSILDPNDARSLRLPMSPQVRSLNLATTVGVVLFEHQRQIRQLDAEIAGSVV